MPSVLSSALIGLYKALMSLNYPCQISRTQRTYYQPLGAQQ